MKTSLFDVSFFDLKKLSSIQSIFTHSNLPQIHPILLANIIKRSLILLCLLGVTTLATSCQTITKFKCNNEDWVEVGMQDGRVGKFADEEFSVHYSTCSSAGAEIDEAVYLQGYNAGLSEFCVYGTGLSQAMDGQVNNQLCAIKFGSDFDNGYTDGLSGLCTTNGGEGLGLSGKAYRATCPAIAETDFLSAYVGGLNYYIPASEVEVLDMRDKQSNLYTSIAVMELRIRRKNSALAKAEEKGVESTIDELSEELATLEERKDELYSKSKMLRTQIIQMESSIVVAKQMLLEWGDVN